MLYQLSYRRFLVRVKEKTEPYKGDVRTLQSDLPQYNVWAVSQGGLRFRRVQRALAGIGQQKG